MATTLRLLADENIAFAREFFGPLGELRLMPGRAITPADVREVDVLLVRSVTQVDARLLAGSAVKFVGSCTIGTDHVDSAWLAQQGIRFAWAPGCNARAVFEYVLSALVALQVDLHAGTRVGVVGCGNVGGQLLRCLLRAGVDAVGCDPLLPASTDLPLLTLDELIERCNVICLHTPLTRGGDHPTCHLFDAERLAALKAGTLLLNAGRGAVIDNQALLARLEAGADLRVVLDVWESEPALDARLLARVALGTPHIAGYSAEGKWRGTAMIHEALCAFLGRQSSPRPVERAQDDARLSTASWQQWLRDVYDIRQDDAALRAAWQAEGATGFDRLRRDYHHRFEGAGRVLPPGLPVSDRLLLTRLGFGCDEAFRHE